ncbi:MAG: hypothetical protein NC132_06905 [Corallococcus sp.]|nr:hypothetical protein [Corallococcus sp.]
MKIGAIGIIAARKSATRVVTPTFQAVQNGNADFRQNKWPSTLSKLFSKTASCVIMDTSSNRALCGYR